MSEHLRLDLRIREGGSAFGLSGAGYAVAVYSFPADAFLVEGDPEAVRESGRSYGRFAATAAGLRGLDSGAWVGCAPTPSGPSGR